uniref:Stomatin n=1 Tax=Tetraodon nigroviridis TaxID=99883 RepID=H3D9B8_TETNG
TQTKLQQTQILISTNVSNYRKDTKYKIGLCGWILVLLSVIFLVATLPFSMWLCIKIVKEYEHAIIFRLGWILGGTAKGPRLFFILPCIDSMVMNMRIVNFDIPPQRVLTKDSMTVSVDGVVYYRVQNARLAVANVTKADVATQLLAQTTLRNALGTKSLAEILSDREEISHSMQCTLDEATDDWGIKVERVEIKDVKLPRAMAAEAEAAREAKAKMTAAEGEMNASRALTDASLVITSIATKKHSTIILPLPLNFMHGFSKR